MKNLSRSHRIMVAIAATKDKRDTLLESAMVAAGFARIRTDARKIISPSINDVDLETAFFIAVRDYNFSSSAVISQRLVRMAISGIPVFLSASAIPNQYMQFCEIVNQQV